MAHHKHSSRKGLSVAANQIRGITLCPAGHDCRDHQQRCQDGTHQNPCKLGLRVDRCNLFFSCTPLSGRLLLLLACITQAFALACDRVQGRMHRARNGQLAQVVYQIEI